MNPIKTSSGSGWMDSHHEETSDRFFPSKWVQTSIHIVDKQVIMTAVQRPITRPLNKPFRCQIATCLGFPILLTTLEFGCVFSSNEKSVLPAILMMWVPVFSTVLTSLMLKFMLSANGWIPGQTTIQLTRRETGLAHLGWFTP